MGLLGSILGAIPGVGSIISAQQNKKAIKKSSAAQIAALQNAIGESTRQFNATSEAFAPFTQAGTAALGQQGDILGLNGMEPQDQALNRLRESPFFQTMFRTGEEAVLQNASATGGLRGGNTQRSLADFGADTFMRTILQQLAGLGGISAQGANMAGQLGQFGAANSSAIGNMMVGQGNAQAGSILGRQAVDNNLTSQLSAMVQMALPHLGLGSVFGGGTGALGKGTGMMSSGALPSGF